MNQHRPTSLEASYGQQGQPVQTGQVKGVRVTITVDLLTGPDCSYIEAHGVVEDILSYIRTHTDEVKMSTVDIKENPIEIPEPESISHANPNPNLNPNPNIPPVPIFSSDQLS